MHSSREASFTGKHALGWIAHHRWFITRDTLWGYVEWKGEKCWPHEWNQQYVFWQKFKKHALGRKKCAVERNVHSGKKCVLRWKSVLLSKFSKTKLFKTVFPTGYGKMFRKVLPPPPPPFKENSSLFVNKILMLCQEFLTKQEVSQPCNCLYSKRQ